MLDAIDFLERADHIVMMDAGSIIHQGSYADMLEAEQFQELLKINDLNKRVSGDSDEDKDSSKKEESSDKKKEEGSDKKKKELTIEQHLDECDKSDENEIIDEPEESKEPDFVYPSKLSKLEKMRKCIEF